MMQYAEDALEKTIALITGLNKRNIPLGAINVEDGDSKTQNKISGFFKAIISGHSGSSDNILFPIFNTLKKAFLSFYSDEKNMDFLRERLEILDSDSDTNTRAKAVSEIWAPEIALSDADILPKWQIHNVAPNPKPYQPDEIVLQLNSLYSLPEMEPEVLPQSIREEWDRAKDMPDDVIFNYDHPVALFSSDDNHELVSCLNELDIEIGFEKNMDVFSGDYRVPVIISVSVTHPRIDYVCGLWLQHILAEKKYHHLELYLVTEQMAEQIKEVLGFYPEQSAVFSVIGKYSNHFNLLKYIQLIFEKIQNIRAGFKLDTDEGIRSQDLYAATGKTWFQTMCHEYWGGTARDDHRNPVYLGVNQGEYINEKDILEFGYKNCLRKPDVSFNGNYQGPEIFFNKGVAHAKTTSLYNQEAEILENFLSHPVVKGGGYGIDNAALREYVPFTFSKVGRAEDQQFYMAGLAKGNRGIFTPDLRIAHYKQSIAITESATEISRFLGDMFRLVIFQEIVGFLGVKEKIDPMPGVFAGRLARIQAFFNIIYKSYIYCADGEIEKGDILFNRGMEEFMALIEEIDSGQIKENWKVEQKDWENFIKAVDSCDRNLLAAVIQEIKV